MHHLINIRHVALFAPILCIGNIVATITTCPFCVSLADRPRLLRCTQTDARDFSPAIQLHIVHQLLLAEIPCQAWKARIPLVVHLWGAHQKTLNPLAQLLQLVGPLGA